MSNDHEDEEESSKIEIEVGHASMPLWLKLVVAGLIIWGIIYLYLYWYKA